MRSLLDSTAHASRAVIPVFLTLQLSLISELHLLVPPATSFCCGPHRAMLTVSRKGAVVAFAIGLSFDLFLQTPFGLSALAIACLRRSSAGFTARSTDPSGGSLRWRCSSAPPVR